MELLEGVERSCLGCGKGEDGIIVSCFYEFGFTIFAVPDVEGSRKSYWSAHRGTKHSCCMGCRCGWGHYYRLLDGGNRPLW